MTYFWAPDAKPVQSLFKPAQTFQLDVHHERTSTVPQKCLFFIPRKPCGDFLFAGFSNPRLEPYVATLKRNLSDVYLRRGGVHRGYPYDTSGKIEKRERKHGSQRMVFAV